MHIATAVAVLLAMLAIVGTRLADAALDTSVAAPASVAATASGSTLTVTWTDGGNNAGSIKGYLVHDNGQYAQFLAGGATSATLTGLADGSTHLIQVRAQNTAGDWSNPTAAPEVTIGGGEPPEPPVGETTQIRNSNSDKCADVENMSLDTGVKFQQWRCHSGLNQQFAINSVGGGFHQLIAAHSGKCIEVRNSSTANGAWVTQAACDDGSNQHFSFPAIATGFRQIKARHSDKCLDVAGISVENNARIQQWRCVGAGSTNQHWSFTGGDTPVGPGEPVADPIPGVEPVSALSAQLEPLVQVPAGRAGPAKPNYLSHAGDGSGRLFVNDMAGGVLYDISPAGEISPFLDVAGWRSRFRSATSQQGFSYFAFHPEFASNGRLYTVHSESHCSPRTACPIDFPVTGTILDNNGNSVQSSHVSVVTEWTASNPAAGYFAGTRRQLFTVEQPYADHNMGQIGFNPAAQPGDADFGLLYLAIADGGSNGFPVSDTDPLDSGQDLGVVLGKILRIDVSGSNSASGTYGIPASNPDLGAGSLGEIWAYGLRNPHRFSWDTGGANKMLISDIGQAVIEEINLGAPGANYGWGEREGNWLADESDEDNVYPLPADDAGNGYTYPVAMYDHDIPAGINGFYGVAVSGGFVYRGSDVPALRGQYVFADFGHDGRFFITPESALGAGSPAPVAELRFDQGGSRVSFGQILGGAQLRGQRTDARLGIDEDGEILVTSKTDGWVRRLR